LKRLERQNEKKKEDKNYQILPSSRKQFEGSFINSIPTMDLSKGDIDGIRTMTKCHIWVNPNNIVSE
jgi:hypothetical protein